LIFLINSINTKLTFDLSDFDNADGEYSIVDVTTGEDVSSFTAKKGVNEVEFNPKKVGSFAILKNNAVLGIIDVVDDIKTTDLEKTRNKFLSQ